MLAMAFLLPLTLSAQSKTVKIGTLHFPPNIDEDLPGYGFVGEFMKAIFEPYGYEVEIKVVPWARAYEDGKAGIIDAVWPSIMTEERKQWFVFSNVALESKYVLLTRKDAPIVFNDLSDLKQYTIGVLRGGSSGSELDTMPDIRKVQGTSFEDNLRMLLAGRIDAMTAEYVTVRYLLDTGFKADAPKLAFAEKPLSVISLYLMFSKKSAQRDALVADFNAGLARIQASGVYETLLEKYRMEP